MQHFEGKRLWSVALVVALIIFFGSETAIAQVGSAGIRGVVRDASGAVIPGVELTVTNVDTNQQRVLVSNEFGLYSAPGLQRGNYEVTAELPGFQRFVSRGIVLTVGSEVAVDVVLQVGEITQAIEVTAIAQQVQTTTSDMSELVDSTTMRELPLNGRNYAALALLQPGVTDMAQAISTGSNAGTIGHGLRFSVNGARYTDNAFMLDGQNIQDFFNSTPSNAGGETLGVDALEEFEVKTANYSAEYAKATGGVISAVTKSGTNQLRGSAFWFLRNDNLDAANFFDNREGIAKPEFKRNQFGATLGGPIVPNQTFFFFSYEGVRQNQGNNVRQVVPTTDAINGLIDGVQYEIAPEVVPYLNLYFPNRPNGDILSRGRGEYFALQTQTRRNDNYVAKVDHQFSDATSLSVRYTIDDGLERSPSGRLAIRTEPVRNQFANIQLQHIFSPEVLNTIRIGYNRSVPGFSQESLSDIPESIHVNTRGTEPIINVSGFTGSGFDVRRPRSFVMNMFDVEDTLSITRGRHQLKIGGNIQWHQYNVLSTLAGGGLYVFTSFPNFVRARPRFLRSATNWADFYRGFRHELVGLYVQDDWRATDRLTLNLGVRWETFTPVDEVNGKVSNLYDFFDAELTVGEQMYQNETLLNFAPRVGLAWDIFGDGSTAVRAAGGIFYPHVLSNAYRQPGVSNPPFGARPTYFDAVFPRDSRLDDPFEANAVFSIPNEYDTARVYQWNLGVQRQLPGGMILDLGYVGSRGTHLQQANVADDANTPFPEIVNGRSYWRPGLTDADRRNPNFSGIVAVFLDGESYYHGLTLSLRRRLQAGLQFQLAHTYSHSIDTSSAQWSSGLSGGSVRQDAWDTSLQRGSSNYDMRHNFSGNLLYDLPGLANATGVAGALLNGWQLSNILSLRTGLPFQVSVDGPPDRDGDLVSRNYFPDLAPGFTADQIVTGDIDRFINPDAFLLPEPGFKGNMGRNILRGKGFFNVDMALKKQFEVREGVVLQFRAEAFNVLNHTNFSLPTNTEIFQGSRFATPVDVAEVTSTVNRARQIQFGLKLTW